MRFAHFRPFFLTLGSMAALSSCDAFRNDPAANADPAAATPYAAGATANPYAAPNQGYPPAPAYGAGTNYGQPPAAGGYTQPPYTQPSQPPAGPGYSNPAYDAGAYPGSGSATGNATVAAPAASGRVHKVVHGDTLSGISKRYGVSTSALMRANNLTNENLIREGQKLNIP